MPRLTRALRRRTSHYLAAYAARLANFSLSLLRRQLLWGDPQHTVRVQGHDVDVAAPPLADAEDYVLRRRHVAELPEPAVEGQRLAVLIDELGEVGVADGDRAVI